MEDMGLEELTLEELPAAPVRPCHQDFECPDDPSSSQGATTSATPPHLHVEDLHLDPFPDWIPFLSAHPNYWLDTKWYDQHGRDPLVQYGVYELPPGDEQTAALKEIVEKYPRYGPKLYEEAADQGRPDVIRALLALGASRDIAAAKRKVDDEYASEVPTVEMVSALHAAAYSGSLDCVKVLIQEAGVSIDELNHFGNPPVMTAAAAGNPEIVAWLLSNGATSLGHDGRGALRSALRGGDMIILRTVLGSEQAREINLTVDLSDLRFAACSGKTEPVQFVLACNILPYPAKSLEHLSDEQQHVVRRSIVQAIGRNALDVLQILLPYATSRQADGSFAYFDTPQGFRMQVLNTIQDTLEEADTTYLFEICWNTMCCHPSATDTTVLDSAPHQITGEVRDRTKYEALSRILITASDWGQLETVKVLVEKYGADVNHVSHKYSITPLGRAAGAGQHPLPGQLRVARYLLERSNIDIHLGNGDYSNDSTALALALHEFSAGDFESAKMISLLLEFGGPVEESPHSVLAQLSSFSDDDDSIGVDVKIVCWHRKPRMPIRILRAKEKVKANAKAVWVARLTYGARDLREIVEGLQVRRSDGLLARRDPKGRPAATREVKRREGCRVEETMLAGLDGMLDAAVDV